MLKPHFKLLTIRRDDDYKVMGHKHSRLELLREEGV